MMEIGALPETILPPEFGQEWDFRFLRLAREVSSWSKDPSTKCGAVIVRDDKTVASVGYNGFPKGCSDHPDLYADREEKYGRVVHAEVNAILHCRESLDLFSTLYTWPAFIMPSCDRCTTVIIQAGIGRVVHCLPNKETMESGFIERWKDTAKRTEEMYQEAGVVVVSYDLDDFRIWDRLRGV